ncbi:uncharacterized protein [Amphiura filiformis]|uniref:uncharacterized protein n=1 Tax=Amphiura filiformis TaxID=82378 RepID=UPI003B218AD8
MSANISEDQMSHRIAKLQNDDLRQQLKKGRASHEECVWELTKLIEKHENKIEAGHLPPKVEKKFRDEKEDLKRNVEKVTKQFERATDEIERRLNEFEKEIEENEKSRNKQGFFEGLISPFLCLLSATGGNFELSESSHDVTASIDWKDSSDQQETIIDLQRQYQAALTSERRQMKSLCKKMSAAENKMAAEEERLLRLVAPTMYVFTAAFTVLRTMQSQFQVHTLLPAMIEMGSLSLPTILSYIFH